MMKTDNASSNKIFYPPGGILLWIIIFLELITFGMGIIAFVYYGKQDSELFHLSKLNLNKTIGVINTLLLLTSGFFMAESVKGIRHLNLQKTKSYLQLTMMGGLLFTILKGIEYFQKIQAGITLDTNLFYTFYWLLTGFHLAHIVVGMIILYFMYHQLTKKIATVDVDDFEASAAFWHMCDLIWLLLFPVLYLLY